MPCTIGLSLWPHDDILHVARTIADLDASENIRPIHTSERGDQLPDARAAVVDVSGKRG
ncbi:MAG: magnesium chelatase subunit ChlI family protein [Thermoguttaceae bacterium]